MPPEMETWCQQTSQRSFCTKTTKLIARESSIVRCTAVKNVFLKNVIQIGQRIRPCGAMILPSFQIFTVYAVSCLYQSTDHCWYLVYKSRPYGAINLTVDLWVNAMLTVRSVVNPACKQCVVWTILQAYLVLINIWTWSAKLQMPKIHFWWVWKWSTR